MQLIARAPDTGRSSSHLSSPRTARVAKAESSRGGGKRTGLSANQAATTTPCLALRFQTGSRTSGVDAHRVHALQGCECREKTHRLKCDPVDVMATVLSRRTHDDGRGCPRMCMHNEEGHRPEVPFLAPSADCDTRWDGRLHAAAAKDKLWYRPVSPDGLRPCAYLDNL